MIDDFTLAHSNREKNSIVYNQNKVLKENYGAKNVFNGFNGKVFNKISEIRINDMKNMIESVKED